MDLVFRLLVGVRGRGFQENGLWDLGPGIRIRIHGNWKV